MSPNKEPHFFSTFLLDRRRERFFTVVRDRRAYEGLFARAGSAVFRGEASTSYLTDPTAPQRIATCNPDASVIAVLRDPVDRAYSHFLYNVREGTEAGVPFGMRSQNRSPTLRASAGPRTTSALVATQQASSGIAGSSTAGCSSCSSTISRGIPSGSARGCSRSSACAPALSPVDRSQGELIRPAPRGFRGLCCGVSTLAWRQGSSSPSASARRSVGC